MLTARLVLAATAVAAGSVLMAVSPAFAGIDKTGPLTFTPNPVTAGSSTTASGVCPEGADFVRVSIDVVLSDTTEVFLEEEFDVDPLDGEFSGPIAIPAGAVAQTTPGEGVCFDDADGEADPRVVGLLSGELEILELVVTTTAAATTAPATTAAATTAPATTAAPPATTIAITLPSTGGSSGSGPVAAIGAVALALGAGLIVVARRHSAGT